jgi:hypothetical protein
MVSCGASRTGHRLEARELLLLEEDIVLIELRDHMPSTTSSSVSRLLASSAVIRIAKLVVPAVHHHSQ